MTKKSIRSFYFAFIQYFVIFCVISPFVKDFNGIAFAWFNPTSIKTNNIVYPRWFQRNLRIISCEKCQNSMNSRSRGLFRSFQSALMLARRSIDNSTDIKPARKSKSTELKKAQTVCKSQNLTSAGGVTRRRSRKVKSVINATTSTRRKRVVTNSTEIPVKTRVKRVDKLINDNSNNSTIPSVNRVSKVKSTRTTPTNKAVKTKQESIQLTRERNNWFDDAEEEIVRQFDGSIFNSPGKSLFDSLYDLSAKSTYNASYTDISHLSLRDISDSYQFSLAYLGDYLVQIGCRPPIDIDANLGNILIGDQIYSLLEAINTLDPFETCVDYDTSAAEIAEELGISAKKVLKICQREGINLPFGINSVIHKTCIDKIAEVYSYDDYDEDQDDFIDVERVDE